MAMGAYVDRCSDAEGLHHACDAAVFRATKGEGPTRPLLGPEQLLVDQVLVGFAKLKNA